jgi:hypothetical protein
MHPYLSVALVSPLRNPLQPTTHDKNLQTS